MDEPRARLVHGRNQQHRNLEALHRRARPLCDILSRFQGTGARFLLPSRTAYFQRSNGQHLESSG